MTHEHYGLVTFVGAGPGDPDLLTLKGRDAIASAALVLYAGSLVPPEIVAYAAPDATVVDSAELTLEEGHTLVREAALAGRPVARLHTGDPSLYGALREQIALLELEHIPWTVIPGVTAACAAAATCGLTFTVPEVTQSLVITRIAGRTPMPEYESIRALATHKTSMAVYLSGKLAPTLQAQLLEAGLEPETPVLCAHAVGWPTQALYWTNIGRLVDCVNEHQLFKQTVFLVLPGELAKGSKSCLYDASFTHERRQGSDAPKTLV